MLETDLRPDAPIAGIEASEVAQRLGVDVAVGLSQAEAASPVADARRQRLTASKKESGFQAFVRQYQDFMQIVLLARRGRQPGRHRETSARRSCWPA